MSNTATAPAQLRGGARRTSGVGRTVDRCSRPDRTTYQKLRKSPTSSSAVVLPATHSPRGPPGSVLGPGPPDPEPPLPPRTRPGVSQSSAGTDTDHASLPPRMTRDHSVPDRDRHRPSSTEGQKQVEEGIRLVNRHRRPSGRPARLPSVCPVSDSVKGDTRSPRDRDPRDPQPHPTSGIRGRNHIPTGPY